MEKCKSKEGKIFFNYPKSSQKGNSNEGMRSSWKRTKIFRPPKISHDEALSQIACHKDALEDERIKKLSFRDVVQPFPMILPSKKKLILLPFILIFVCFFKTLAQFSVQTFFAATSCANQASTFQKNREIFIAQPFHRFQRKMIETHKM